VCFPPHSSGDPGSPVLCSGDPTSNQVVLLDQSGGHLPLDRANAEDLAAPPWFLVLADGKKCRFVGYGTNTADALRYECGDNVGATEPDRSNTRWTVREGLHSSPASLGPPVAVLTAYR
jgi:hypothetical protein